MLVFEDLGSSDFVHTDKANGLDVAHLKLNLQLLAKWHAATAVLLLKVIVGVLNSFYPTNILFLKFSLPWLIYDKIS